MLLCRVCKRRPQAIAAPLSQVSSSTLKRENARRSLTQVAVATTTISARRMSVTSSATVCKDLLHHPQQLIHLSIHLQVMQVIKIQLLIKWSIKPNGNILTFVLAVAEKSTELTRQEKCSLPPVNPSPFSCLAFIP